VEIENLSINTIRFLSVDAVQKANSGHPGMPMACAPIAFSLYTGFMKHNPSNPKWLNRDRFILSAGHGSMLLYSILHLCGYEISLDQLKNFRQWGSITPGHPESGLTPGVETTSGPLGQGFSTAVGMAIAQAYLSAMFNKPEFKLIDHYIYGICSDGDMMEGISHEAASLAGHLKLGKIIFFYDYNNITIDGSTSLAYSDDVQKRFEAYGWHVENIEDVNDLKQIEKALLSAQKDERPSLIITKTHIGYGSPNKQDKSSAHGSPLGVDEVKLTKQNLNWNYEEDFFIPEEVKEYFKNLKVQFDSYESEWNNLFAEYKAKYPAEAVQLIDYIGGKFGTTWKEKLPVFDDPEKKIATRQASGTVLNAIASSLPTLIGGSADLHPSNNTYLKDYKPFNAENYSGRNFHFGIREHVMGAIQNGIAHYGGIITFCGTFLVFADYMRPAIRLAAISHLKVIYVFTHDSIGVGEDGPTHQPVEHFAALRAIPNLINIRPADANETVHAWRFAIEYKDGPVALALTRQNLPVLTGDLYPAFDNVSKGAYILSEPEEKPDVVLMASGSEVHLIVKAKSELEKEGIKVRVVSFPSFELFELQSKEYKTSVLGNYDYPRLAIEAGVSFGWDRYLGANGKIISIDKFGASGKAEVLFEKFGFSVDNIVLKAKELIEK